MNPSAEPTANRRPKLAVYKFSSCDGCQLQLLELEDELLELAGQLEIAYFLEARRQVQPGPYDIGLVEGSISTPEEEDRIRQARRECRVLVAIGACATSGGIQALRNWADVEEYAACVYAHPEYVAALDVASAVAGHVYVDFELRGCPVNKHQLVEVLTAFLIGRRPQVPTYSVCLECKRAGIPCVLVSRSIPCLGPITQAGCGALCPQVHRGCYGCYGPSETPNVTALCDDFIKRLGLTRPEIVRLLRGFNGYLESNSNRGPVLATVAPRRPAGSCITATNWTPTDWCVRPISCRPRRRTSHKSRRISPPSSASLAPIAGRSDSAL